MRLNALLSLLIASVLAVGIAGQVRAHDGDWSGSFYGTGIENAVWIEHQDEDPYEGWIRVTATNRSRIAWGDFHFRIWSPLGDDVSNVDFLVHPPYQPQGRNFDYWVVNNAPPTGATLDLYFWTDPVEVGETVTLSVYTVNPDQVFFGVCFYPTPIPEPSAMVALASGLAGLVALSRRRKS